MKTNVRVDTDNELQTSKTNNSARAQIIIRQLDGEKHVKREMRKWGLQIASSLDEVTAHGFIPKATYKQLSY